MSSMRIPIPENIKVPREAYTFWPEESYILRGSGKKINRFIFEFQNLNPLENEKVTRLEEQIKDGKIEGWEVPKDWSRNNLLRFCYGTNWKTRNAVKELVNHLKWRAEKLPLGYQVLYPKALSLLVRII